VPCDNANFTLGGEAYFAVPVEGRLRKLPLPDLAGAEVLSAQRDVQDRRPNGRLTSIVLKNSQIEQLRKSRPGAHSVV
jgi:hypothetical protein